MSFGFDIFGIIARLAADWDTMKTVFGLHPVEIIIHFLHELQISFTTVAIEDLYSRSDGIIQGARYVSISLLPDIYSF